MEKSFLELSLNIGEISRADKVFEFQTEAEMCTCRMCIFPFLYPGENIRHNF